MPTLNDLVEAENPEPELNAEILPADARLSFTAPVSMLLEMFARAASVSPAKEIVPGTAHALLEVQQTSVQQAAHVRLTATDGDQTVSVVMDQVPVHMAGAALLPARRVLDILKQAPTSTARLEVISSALTIRSGRAMWTVQLPVGEELIGRMDVSGIEMHPISGEELANALAYARIAASATNARISLTQVQMRNGTVTACDGGRRHRGTGEGLSHEINVTIPAKSVDEIIKALRTSEEGMVSFGYDQTHVVVEVGRDIVVAQRLLIDFPDVEPLVLGPTFDNELAITVSRNDLLDAIKRVRVNSDPDSAAITLSVLPGKEDDLGLTWVLVIQARDRLGNAAKEAMLCSWSGTKGRSVTMHHKYISDVLGIVESDEIQIKVGPDSKTVKSPLLIQDPYFLGVIQQMALTL